MMLALTAAGVRVPADVSVVGFDNILAAGLVSPGLTTVAAPLRYDGRDRGEQPAGRSSAARSTATPRPSCCRRAWWCAGRPPSRAGERPVRRPPVDRAVYRSRNSTSPAFGTTSVSGSAS